MAKKRKRWNGKPPAEPAPRPPRFPNPADVPGPMPFMGVGFGPISGLEKPVAGSHAERTIERMDALARDKSLALDLGDAAVALCDELMSGRPWTGAHRLERERIREGLRAIRGGG